MPSVVVVEDETIRSILLSGASAPAQLISSTASASSPPPRSPGSGPFNMTL